MRGRNVSRPAPCHPQPLSHYARLSVRPLELRALGPLGDRVAGSVWFTAPDYLGLKRPTLMWPVPLSAVRLKTPKKVASAIARPPRIADKGRYSANRQLILLATIGSSVFPSAPPNALLTILTILHGHLKC
uniref:Uncharacterized protein n=1 Tax=Knipowitschia caucasica TaxID=637954 RepID=A0AAV2LHS6_KNICA